MQLDNGCDGSGDGGLLTADFAGASNPYTFSIPNGTTLDLRIEVKADEASEELAFDYFQVTGDEVVSVPAVGHRGLVAMTLLVSTSGALALRRDPS